MGDVMSNSFRHLFDRLLKKPHVPDTTPDTHVPDTTPDAPQLTEREILKRFCLAPESVVEELIAWIRKSPVYLPSRAKDWSGRTLVSCSGHITVCLDIFGPEVKIYPSTFLLDCNPSTYGLSRESANRLYEAILTRVPGTSNFKFTPIEL